MTALGAAAAAIADELRAPRVTPELAAILAGGAGSDVELAADVCDFVARDYITEGRELRVTHGLAGRDDDPDDLDAAWARAEVAEKARYALRWHRRAQRLRRAARATR